ncbi:MAG: hypothetical protein AVDCRST_MAG64-3606, partial [uncultured Phycisphaerae bacterium]
EPEGERHLSGASQRFLRGSPGGDAVGGWADACCDAPERCCRRLRADQLDAEHSGEVARASEV